MNMEIKATIYDVFGYLSVGVFGGVAWLFAYGHTTGRDWAYVSSTIKSLKTSETISTRASEFREAHDVFYTNPPYGSADGGECGKLFLARCMEFCKPAPSWGIALLPFAHKEDWSRKAMMNIQEFLCSNGYVVSEMIREVHQYHLDDRPSLRSCNVVVDRVYNKKPSFGDTRVKKEDLAGFYGRTSIDVPEYISLEGELVYKDDDSNKQ